MRLARPVYTFNNLVRFCRWYFFAAVLSCAVVTRAEVFINEVLFNPPGSDLPNEYVELRGTPNQVLASGTYFVAVEGDLNGNPGTVQNVFDLSRRSLSGSGLLVLLQNSNSFVLHSNTAALINTNGSGFGHANPAPTRHRGEGGQTDLENGSTTFLLVRAANLPRPGDDIDTNNDGVPDGAVFAGWMVLDAVAVLDNDGAGDIGYGRINFRRNAAATVTSGTVVSVAFTPSYVGRAGNTTNWEASAWVASGGFSGTAPNWTLSSTETAPAGFGGQALNHLGAPNFGVAATPGVVARETGFSTDVAEGAGIDTYSLVLNVAPSGSVTVRISASGQAQVSIDAGASWHTTRSVVLTGTTPTNVLVRALDDTTVDSSPHPVPITHAITASTDARYPLNALAPVVPVNVAENDSALLNELKVNPPGEDSPFEYIELRGTPNGLITNVYLVVLEGDADANPGKVDTVIELHGAQFGSAGVIIIAADGHPYSVPAGARVVLAPELDLPGGGLGNGSATFLLLSSPSPIVASVDLDAGDNGTLEGLPFDTTLLDSLAWSEGKAGDVLYAIAVLTTNGAPDAAMRVGGNSDPNSAAAWVFGDLEGTGGDGLAFEHGPGVSYGTALSPGFLNNTAPRITGIGPYSSVIGDPTSPLIRFQISDGESPVANLTVSVSSDNPAVVPNSNLVLGGSGAQRTLAIDPVGVGYAIILLSVSDGERTGYGVIQYAASQDELGGGRFHTGVSDASAALALDNHWMLVGDDENQVLRLYSRSNSGPAIAEFPMNPFLGLLDLYANGNPREIDIEGATRVGNRLYWIGSHSHAQNAESRTNRGRIFATDLAGAGTNISLSYVGRYDYLKLDLMAWDASNAHGKGADYYGLTASGAEGMDPKAPDGSGFNIEGLTMAPGSTNVAYVCFRSPLVPPTNRVKALVVPVTNFHALASGQFTNAGAAQFGAPMELNLGGRGVRTIEGDANGYLLVAGPPGVATGIPPVDFRLFTWNGLPTGVPQQRGAVITNMIPEAMAELPPAPWTASSQVQLVSDNGITVYYGDDVQAKFLPVRQFKKYRSDWIALGPVVTPQPVIKSMERAGANVMLTWYAVAGTTYRVQSKASLSDPQWSNVPGDVVAAEALASKAVTLSGGARFFRVVVP